MEIFFLFPSLSPSPSLYVSCKDMELFQILLYFFLRPKVIQEYLPRQILGSSLEANTTVVNHIICKYGREQRGKSSLQTQLLLNQLFN